MMLSMEQLQRFPVGFFDLYSKVAAGEPLPRELAQGWSTGDSPHIAYPLRAVPDLRFKLVDESSGDRIGTIEHEKAIREAYPGATYLHFGRMYRATQWRNASYENSIVMRPVKNGQRTHALLSTHLSTSLGREDVLEERLLRAASGTLGELRMLVSDSVEGYRKGNQTYLYADLSKTDNRMRRKRRQFSTTGVFLRLTGTSFDGDNPAAVAARRELVSAIAAVAARELGIAPAEIRTAHINIMLCEQTGARRLNDAVAIFDNVAGSVRLTSGLFDRFGDMIERLRRGAEAAADEALLDEQHVDELADWFADLQEAVPDAAPQLVPDDSEYRVLAPGSVMGIRIRGELIERTLLEPQLVPVGDVDQLMYRYESAPGVSAFAPEDRLESICDEYRYVLWNPSTGEMRELPQ